MPVIILLVLFVVGMVNAEVRKHRFFSSVLNRMLECNYYLPNDFDARAANGERFPVVYLLHGCNGSHDVWHRGFPQNFNPETDLVIDSVNLIAVAIYDGTGVSWWVDSPFKPEWKTATFILEDVQPMVERLFPILRGPKNTGICGVSMGGFGAFHLARTYPDRFGIVYGIVPAVHIQKWVGYWGTDGVFGKYAEYPENWAEHDILPNAHLLGGKELSIRFHTTQGDIFRDDCNAFDSALTAHSIPHEYTVLPTGGHDLPDRNLMLTILKYFDSTFSRIDVSVHQPPRIGTYPHAGFSSVGLKPRWTGNGVVVGDGGGRTYRVNGTRLSGSAGSYPAKALRSAK